MKNFLHFGFSPDADFPCIYAEKSILNASISMKYSINNSDIIKILEVNCNNNALNVATNFCSIILSINPNKLQMKNLIKLLKDIISKNNFEIDIYQISTSDIKLTSYGIQAHGAHPDLGTNAISQLILVINNVFTNYNVQNDLFNFFSKYIKTDYNGKLLDINFEDESGKLTLNVGCLSLENSILEIGMNIRIPINTPVDTIKEAFNKTCSLNYNLNFNEKSYNPSLYLPKDNILVSTLCKVFNEETNSNFTPIAIGGATYARAFKNCISFGANFPGAKDMCHQTDEFIDIDNLILSCKIYAMSILKLSSKEFKIQ